jgi:uncharacterized protein
MSAARLIRGLAPVALSAALLAAAGFVPAGAQAQRPPLELASFPRTALEIAHRDAQHGTHKFPFEVWIADTPERAQQGLMFVSDLPANRGMVFPAASPRVETMWMRNTYIELDMLFIDAKGAITKIIERAHPLSDEILSSDTPVSAVLELRGGEAHKLGLAVGDLVTWKKPAP